MLVFSEVFWVLVRDGEVKGWILFVCICFFFSKGEFVGLLLVGFVSDGLFRVVCKFSFFHWTAKGLLWN